MTESIDVPSGPTCLVCGGRGGWWSWEFRESCSRCEGTGWEPSGFMRDWLTERGLGQA